MIDLHSHILPGIDDGAHDIAVSLEMARIAVADGISVMACTPHFYPGVYDSYGPDILARIETLQIELHRASIPLQLVAGGDLRLEPNLLIRIKSGEALALNGSRYALIEPAHQLFTQGMERFFAELLGAGIQPILTHPERMAWIEQKYDAITRLFNSGVWMQITAGAVTGRFGRRVHYWSERMVKEGMAHILATDAHDPTRRPPLMREAFDEVAEWVGEVEAQNLVYHRPKSVLENQSPLAVPIHHQVVSRDETAAPSLWTSIKSFIING
jgi:protein-tyrosine phosphatase